MHEDLRVQQRKVASLIFFTDLSGSIWNFNINFTHVFTFPPTSTCQINLTDFSYGDVTEVFLHDHLVFLFAYPKMWALKSYCYVKIMIINNGSTFRHKIFQNFQYFLLSLPETSWRDVGFLLLVQTRRQFNQAVYLVSVANFYTRKYFQRI